MGNTNGKIAPGTNCIENMFSMQLVPGAIFPIPSEEEYLAFYIDYIINNG
jgi:hypothetical protein